MNKHACEVCHFDDASTIARPGILGGRYRTLRRVVRCDLGHAEVVTERGHPRRDILGLRTSGRTQDSAIHNMHNCDQVFSKSPHVP